MRLDRLLAEQNISRKRMKQLLQRGQILVDGRAARRLSQNVDCGLQTICLEGKAVQGQPHRYWILHKPAGYVTANRDTEKATVLDLIEEDCKEQLYSVGRLDRDTEELLLLTDNGPLGFQLLHPQYHVDKTYYVEVNGPLSPDDVAAFAKGIVFLDGTVCQPAQLMIHSSAPFFSRAAVTLSEGKFHQIKKMFLAVGVKVIYLKRTHFAGFRLDTDLAKGNYRPLNQEEFQTIKRFLEESW
ncbi:pseudouridine synthase [Streptococcus sp. DD11]|uniref:pseudouridine synthase n=1 Tax=Streptococcus sp. DD11 TaxID=1777879 RepID=UPI000AE91474|nr:pseudouridine synthase [Streptococcus sp. DD11]